MVNNSTLKKRIANVKIFATVEFTQTRRVYLDMLLRSVIVCYRNTVCKILNNRDNISPKQQLKFLS